jgi:hypothetical protein
VARARRYRIEQRGEVLRYGARNHSAGEYRYQLWRVVFVQRDERGYERIYRSFKDLAPVDRTNRPAGYAHDELVDPVSHCPMCGRRRLLDRSSDGPSPAPVSPQARAA